MNPPPGFEHFTSRRWLSNHAQLFFKRRPESTPVFGTWVGEQQSNSQGMAHGGVLLSLAEFILSCGADAGVRSMTAQFLRPARIGTWIEATVDIRRTTRRLIFADTRLLAAGAEVLLASGLLVPTDVS